MAWVKQDRKVICAILVQVAVLVMLGAIAYCTPATKSAQGGSVRLKSTAQLTTIPDVEIIPSDELRLGSLLPGEEREFEIQIRNDGGTTCDVAPPVIDCGCIRTNDDPVSLKPSAQQGFSFLLRAPWNTGTLEKSVTFHTQSGDALGVVRIRAEVATALTATPRSLTLTLDSEGRARGCVELMGCSDDLDALVRIASGNPCVNVSADDTLQSGCRLAVCVDDTDIGRGTCQIFGLDHSGRVLFSTPVNWDNPNRIHLWPAVVVFSSTSDASGGKVIARIPAVETGNEVRLRTSEAAPWLNVVGIRRLGHSGYWSIDYNITGDGPKQGPHEFTLFNISTSCGKQVRVRGRLSRNGNGL